MRAYKHVTSQGQKLILTKISNQLSNVEVDCSFFWALEHRSKIFCQVTQCFSPSFQAINFLPPNIVLLNYNLQFYIDHVNFNRSSTNNMWVSLEYALAHYIVVYDCRVCQ